MMLICVVHSYINIVQVGYLALPFTKIRAETKKDIALILAFQ